MSDHYHHGNLRQALIDAGVKIINESGEENLSLRKVAALCEVSHAAPYSHFKDKDALIEAIKAHVTGQFMEELEKAVNEASSAEKALVDMGRNYVAFFLRRPDYFKFLFFLRSVSRLAFQVPFQRPECRSTHSTWQSLRGRLSAVRASQRDLSEIPK